MGEDYAEKYLKRHGFEILERNYSRPYGEIDIIAKKKELLVFVEVKTRHENSVTIGREAVNIKKQRRIIKAASAYYCEHGFDCYCRFDVCEVVIDSQKLKPKKCIHIENAFISEGDYAPV